MFFASFDCILKTAQGFYFSLIVRFYLYIYIYIYTYYTTFIILLCIRNPLTYKKKKTKLQMRFLKRSCGIYTRKLSTYIHRNMCIYVNTY